MNLVQRLTALTYAGDGEADDVLVPASYESDMESRPDKDPKAHPAAGTPPDLLLRLCLHAAIACHEGSIEDETLRKRYADVTQTIRRKKIIGPSQDSLAQDRVSETDNTLFLLAIMDFGP
jgi:hypothetical protein